MICNFTHFSIALLWFLPVFSSAQTQDCREGSGAGEE